jgi:hypothetical protein
MHARQSATIAVMPALVAGIHDFAISQQIKPWMAGRSPAEGFLCPILILNPLRPAGGTSPAMTMM